MVKSLALGMCLALTLAACASTPRAPAKATAKAIPLGCVGGTGTRLPAKDNQCTGFGSVYTQDDLNRTGATTPGEALRLLDPAITVVGH
jgi:hypothetical protein